MTRLFAVLLILQSATVFAAEPRSRTFHFTYEATVSGLKPGQEARIWIPAPQTNDDQEVLDTELSFPSRPAVSVEPTSGNKICYLAAKAGLDGTIAIKSVYTIKRKEIRGETDLGLTDGLDRFLKPDPLAPPDGKHLQWLAGHALPADSMGKAKAVYELVNGRMRYAKEGTGWGRGDVNWVCDSRFGNCTDFHSLFIALVRSQKIPARFEAGFGLPAKRGKGEIAGYHCWAKFKPDGKGWVPVDISEANKNPKMADYYFGNLTEDRVAFSTGRGLTLSPKQDGPPLNFFVYPYVEVGGKPYPDERVKRHFAFEDVK